MGLHWQELLILLVLALVIFGPRRLPEIGRSLGHSLREFKQSVSGTTSEFRDAASIVEDAGTAAAEQSPGALPAGPPVTAAVSEQAPAERV